MSDIQTKGKAALDKMDTEVPNLIKAMENLKEKQMLILGSTNMLAATEEYAICSVLINNVFGKNYKDLKTAA